jgi:hypothetical protein
LPLKGSRGSAYHCHERSELKEIEEKDETQFTISILANITEGFQGHEAFSIPVWYLVGRTSSPFGKREVDNPLVKKVN